MGKVMSSIRHPFRNFNVESRAHKIISQDKPTPAPKFEKSALDLDRLMKEYPEVYEASLKKHDELGAHLKDVYVTSTDTKIEPPKATNPSRPLPSERTPAFFEYGMKEPEKVPEGKITLRKLLQFISDHQNDGKVNTVEVIASQYKLPQETVKNVLKYFGVFEIYMPVERSVKAKFAGPSLPKNPVHIIKDIRKQLPLNDDKKKDT